MKKWIQQFKKWRRKHEWTKKYPDPFIVCGLAKKCQIVDGPSCKPHECEMLIGINCPECGNELEQIEDGERQCN